MLTGSVHSDCLPALTRATRNESACPGRRSPIRSCLRVVPGSESHEPAVAGSALCCTVKLPVLRAAFQLR